MKAKVAVLFAGIVLAGCATTPSATSGTLGQRPYRNVVVLGEHQSRDLAQQYANTYNASVLYTPGRGVIADAVSTSIRGTLGPTRAMRDLIKDLESLNHTEGAWMLIVPSVAERYFLVTLRNMADGALSNAHATVWLPESAQNDALETEVARVSGGVFVMQYGVRE